MEKELISWIDRDIVDVEVNRFVGAKITAKNIGRSCDRAVFLDCFFEDVEFRGVSFTNVVFSENIMRNISFINCSFKNTVFQMPNICSNIRFDKVEGRLKFRGLPTMKEPYLSDITIKDSDIVFESLHCNFDRLTIVGCNLSKMSFQDTRVYSSFFQGLNMGILDSARLELHWSILRDIKIGKAEILALNAGNNTYVDLEIEGGTNERYRAELETFVGCKINNLHTSEGWGKSHIVQSNFADCDFKGSTIEGLRISYLIFSETEVDLSKAKTSSDVRVGSKIVAPRRPRSIIKRIGDRKGFVNET